MFGFSRKERNTKLAKALGFKYDDKEYVRQAKEGKLKPLSIKQLALMSDVKNPLVHKTIHWKGCHEVADEKDARGYMHVSSDGVTNRRFVGEESAYEFFADKVASKNKSIYYDFQPYLNILQEMIANQVGVTAKNAPLELVFEAELNELVREDEGYYYEPSQKLSIQRNGERFSLV